MGVCTAALGGEGDVQISQAPKSCGGSCIGEVDCISSNPIDGLHAWCDSFCGAFKIQMVGSEDDSSALDREGRFQWRALPLCGGTYKVPQDGNDAGKETEVYATGSTGSGCDKH